jgi:glucosamine kinase
MSIGGAGLYVQKPRDAFVARLPDFAAVLTMSDGYAALIGAGRGKPCALITIGTGVAGHRLYEDGSSIQRDAWGWIVGDRGGGVWMGTRAFRHMAEVLDGLVEPSVLSRAVMERVGGMPGLLGGALSNLSSHKLASFAPLVLDAEKAGCPVAGSIVARAVRHLSDLVRVLNCNDVPLHLNGGLADALGPRLAETMGRAVQDAWGDALTGCLLVARGEAPRERAIFN